MESSKIVHIEIGDDEACEKTRVQILDTVGIEKNMLSVLTGGKIPEENVSREAQKTINRDKVVSPKIKVQRVEESRRCITYKCEHCTVVFTTSKEFKYHCKSKHGVTHPYKCEHCDNVYTHKAALNVHVRVHTNDRPFSCDECGRSFSQSSSLASHMLRHSGATPHTCDICGKSFVLKGELGTHYRIHLPTKPFHCKDCNLSFPRKSNFTRHMRKHTGEKPYACKFCSKTFARSENRDEHQRTHTNERPYACKICGATFSDSGNFSKHKRVHVCSNVFKRRRCKANANDDVKATAEVSNKIAKVTDNIQKKERSLKSRKLSRARTKEKDSTPAPITINLVQKPLLTDINNTSTLKPLPQLFVTMPDVIKANHLTGFIKLGDTMNTTPKDMETPGDIEMELSQPSEFNYQYSGLLSTQTNLPVLNYSNNLNSHGYNMMLDYSRDSSYSFHNDASLILPENSFAQTSSNPLTGTDDYIYGSSMAPHELTDHGALQNSLFTREDSVGASLVTNSHFNLESSSSDERQPLDTSKFLNEQYLMKKEDKPLE